MKLSDKFKSSFFMYLPLALPCRHV